MGRCFVVSDSQCNYIGTLANRYNAMFIYISLNKNSIKFHSYIKVTYSDYLVTLFITKKKKIIIAIANENHLIIW